MRRQGWALLLVVLAACGQPSDVDPDAAVTVSGRALRADGSPAGGAAVAVTTEIGPAELAADAPLFFGTAGLICFTPADLDVCDEHGTSAEADSEGAFTVELRGSDVQSGFGTVSTLWATVAAPGRREGGEPATSYAFTANDERVRLPALTLWEPEVSVEVRGGRVAVRAPRLPEAYGKAPRYRTHLVTEAGTPAWVLRRRGGTFDHRILEDLNGTLSVEAALDRGPGDLDGAIVHRSGAVPFTGPGAPPSRGATCSAVATGRERVDYDPCPLTDGDMGQAFDPALDPQCRRKGGCPHPDTVVLVDLGALRDIDLLVLRADDDRYVLSASGDGKRWRRVSVATVRDGQAVITPETAQQARYIRVAAHRWPLATLRELSAW